ncbi:hypothetical protein KEJ25_04750 [Candidatus Bathyarchaeota archaeon]|nr:hypothetical protein [Candidatus Bathyarchaeota archaeon]
MESSLLRKLDAFHNPSAVSIGNDIVSIRRDCSAVFANMNSVDATASQVKVSFEYSLFSLSRLRIPINARAMCSGLSSRPPKYVEVNLFKLQCSFKMFSKPKVLPSTLVDENRDRENWNIR